MTSNGVKDLRTVDGDRLELQRGQLDELLNTGRHSQTGRREQGRHKGRKEGERISLNYIIRHAPRICVVIHKAYTHG